RSAVFQADFVNVLIPMIKVKNQDRTPCAAGIDAIRSILECRLDVAAMIEQDALELAISKTGGVLRHLFEALTHAAFVASQAIRKDPASRPGERIIKSDVRYGLNRVKATLLTRLGTLGLPDEFKDVTVKDLNDRIKRLVGQSQRVPQDLVNLLLL